MNKPVSLTLSLSFILSILFYLTGCGIYSFTGSKTNAKTITIQEFYNNADLGPATMGQSFTNRLKDYFLQNTSLSVAAQDGELLMDGEITNYTLTPIAPVSTGDNQITPAAMTRLTVTVKVNYVNTLDESMSFQNKTFSFYKDFPNEQNLSDVEEAYLREIFDRIVNDIFNASVANW